MSPRRIGSTRIPGDGRSILAGHIIRTGGARHEREQEDQLHGHIGSKTHVQPRFGIVVASLANARGGLRCSEPRHFLYLSAEHDLLRPPLIPWSPFK